MSALILRPAFPDNRDPARWLADHVREGFSQTVDEFRSWAESMGVTPAAREWSAAGDSVSMDVTVMEGEQRDE